MLLWKWGLHWIINKENTFCSQYFFIFFNFSREGWDLRSRQGWDLCINVVQNTEPTFMHKTLCLSHPVMALFLCQWSKLLTEKLFSNSSVFSPYVNGRHFLKQKPPLTSKLYSPTEGLVSCYLPWRWGVTKGFETCSNKCTRFTNTKTNTSQGES